MLIFSNNWCKFHLHSNVLWCHYLLDKMINDQHQEGNAGHLRELDNLLGNMLDGYKSAKDLLMRSS